MSAMEDVPDHDLAKNYAMNKYKFISLTRAIPGMGFGRIYVLFLRC